MKTQFQEFPYPLEFGIADIKVALSDEEHVDTSRTLEIVVRFQDGEENFLLVSTSWMEQLIKDGFYRGREFQTFGIPLILMKEITAPVALEALLMHLRQENGRYDEDSPRPSAPRSGATLDRRGA